MTLPRDTTDDLNILNDFKSRILNAWIARYSEKLFKKHQAAAADVETIIRGSLQQHKLKHMALINKAYHAALRFFEKAEEINAAYLMLFHVETETMNRFKRKKTLPNNKNDYSLLASSYFKLGHKYKAKASLEALMDLDPQDRVITLKDFPYLEKLGV